MANQVILTNRGINRERRKLTFDDNRILVEAIKQPLYSRKQLAVSGSQTVTFFQSSSSIGKLETNLNGQNNLPSPQSFSMWGISAKIQEGTSKADIEKLNNYAVLQFSLSSKPYLDLPLHYIPSHVGKRGLATVTDLYQPYNHTSRGMFDLSVNRIPIDIFSQQEFNLTLTTSSSADFSSTIYITFYLHGVLYRPVL